MRRYWALSILLHFIVFVSFVNKKNSIIEDPIVSVSIDFRKKPQPAQTKAEPPSRLTPVVNAKSQTKEIANPDANNRNRKSTESPQNLIDRSAYEAGNVAVKPKVLKQVQVTYPLQAKEARIEGAVRLSVLINEVGQVDDVIILEGPGFGLNEAAQLALQQFVFSPAESEGRKVPVRIVYIYRFKLESR